MVNRRRGEIEAEIAGGRYKLVLTLGALAELEDAFGVEDMTSLGERLANSKLSARDIINILQAGLNGAGSQCDIASTPVADALPELAKTVTELLNATFGQDSSKENKNANPKKP